MLRSGRLFLVADGVGGAQGGREASSSAAKIVVERYYELNSSDPGASLRVAIQEANSSLYQQVTSRPSLQDTGTTMTAAVAKDGVLHVANVGDSRAYLIRNGQIQQLTRDHTLTQQRLDRGLIRSEEAELDDGQNVLTRSLGAGPTVQVDVYPPLQLAPGDVILLCSDGLTDMLADQEIARTAEKHSPKRATKKLIHKANKRGGFDNISVVIAKVGGQRIAATGGLLDDLRAMSTRQKTILSVGAVLVAIAWCGMGYLGWTMHGRSRNEPPATSAPKEPTEAVPTSTVAPTTEPTQALAATITPQPTDTVEPGQPTSTPAPTSTPTYTPLPPTNTPTFTPTPEPSPTPTLEQTSDGNGDEDDNGDEGPGPTEPPPTEPPPTEPPPTEKPTEPPPSSGGS
jgi:protein phosphatase